MPRIPIDQLRVGQVVATDVRSSGGAVLIKSGTSLTDAHINRLCSLDLTEVDICLSDTGITDPAALAQLDLRFTGHEDDDLMMDLKAAMHAHLTGRADGS